MVAPATSNTVAKMVWGISDTLVTNIYAQAGKCRVPSIVFACDTAPAMETEAPGGQVMVYPRRIDLENVERLRGFEYTPVVRRFDALVAALGRIERRERAHPVSDRSTGGAAAAPGAGGDGPTPFTWTVRQLGVKVAALMTADMIRRRLTDTGGADRILIPGRCRGDMAALSEHFGIPVERGPEELMDLPRFFGLAGRPPDLEPIRVRIFAEIVDAPRSASTPSWSGRPRTAPTGPTSSTWAACRIPPSRTWKRASAR